jgi:protein-S-isoprenylcysteine O-methyltransferase Ste14
VATSYLQQSHPAAVVVSSIGIVAFSVGELYQAFHLRPGSTDVDRLGEVLFRGLFFGGILMLPLGASIVPGAVIPGGIAPFVVGAVLGWSGLLLRWWSFVVLGHYFTTVLKTSPDQVVVEHGPYRVLRHPSYTGLLLALLGCGLMLGNWVGLLGSFTVLLAAIVYRIRIEERALIATLGDAYRAFTKGRARLVPFLW